MPADSFPTVAPAVVRHPRVDVADVLRGLAVLGIILLHSIEHFNFYSFPPADAQPAWLNFLDRAIWDGMFFLVGGKAYAVFALLFGFSFFIQDDNQLRRGCDFRRRFCWRLFLLFVIGNLNACFFTGEILVLYSLVGFVLVLTCRLSVRTLLVLSGVCLLQPVALWQILRILIDPSYQPMSLADYQYWSDAFVAQSGGGFIDMLLVNIWKGQITSLAWAWEYGRVFQTAALFMLGMLIGRQQWFAKSHLSFWARVFAVAIVLYFPLTGITSMIPDFVDNGLLSSRLTLITGSLQKFCFMLMLVSAVLWLWYKIPAWTSLLRHIIPYGRMSMTNYVTQSIVGSMLFYNWGFGLFRYLGITSSFLVGVGLFIMQYWFCRWWLARFSRGPMEQAWRRATWI